MFERFTDRARRVVVFAQEEARLLNHNYIGTEHLLLGLLNEDEGVAAKALADLKVDVATARQNVVEIIGEGTGTPGGHMPFTPRSKKVLELALREAIGLGHNYIGTKHILLGLIREEDGIAAQVLIKMGLDLPSVRQTVLNRLGVAQSEPSAPPDPGARSEQIRNRCSHPLDRLRYTTKDIPGEGEPLPARVIQCDRCGTVLGVDPV